MGSSLPHHDENEVEMLRRAIAMSLEEQEEGLSFGTGLILKYDIAKSQRVEIKRLQGGCGEGGNIESLEQKTLISNEDMEKAIFF